LTAAGNLAFPGLSNGDLSGGPWHNNFTGNLGGLIVLGDEATADNRNVILGQSSEQRVWLALNTDGMQLREDLAMLLHLLGAEQLRSQWRLIIRIGPCRRLSTQASGYSTPTCQDT